MSDNCFMRTLLLGMVFLLAAAFAADSDLAGAYAGYRQARSLQRALLAPVPTSFLL